MPSFRECLCENPQFAKCLPVAMTKEGTELIRHNDECLGKIFCFYCGGCPSEEPATWDHITGETVVRRLVELGVADELPETDSATHK